MSNAKGKKLLIIGANPETVPLVVKAEELGVHTIVTDYAPGSTAKQYASESFDIDGFDVDGLVSLAKEQSVDGVLVGVADRLIVPYQEVCERLGLPCYGTAEQCAVLTDKKVFTEKCGEYGLQSIPRYEVSEKPSEDELSALPYPVFIKPADGNSGKGMTICRLPLEVPAAIEKAIAFSKTNRYLVERYMECDDIYIFYTFINGFCWPSIIADRYTDRRQQEGSPVCVGAISPSKYCKRYYEQLHPRITKMFSAMGMRNGVLMVSAFVDDEKFYLYDPGFRLQGEAPNLTVQQMTGFDHLRMLIEFALSGKNPYSNCDAVRECRSWTKSAATIWVLLKSGEIGDIRGVNEYLQDPCVFASVVRLGIGDVVLPNAVGTEQQVFARLYIACENKELLGNKIDEANSKICILDTKGDNMIASMLSSHSIFG